MWSFSRGVPSWSQADRRPRSSHSDAEMATPTSALMPRFRRLFATPMPEITEITVPGIRVPGHPRGTF